MLNELKGKIIRAVHPGIPFDDTRIPFGNQRGKAPPSCFISFENQRKTAGARSAPAEIRGVPFVKTALSFENQRKQPAREARRRNSEVYALRK